MSLGPRNIRYSDIAMSFVGSIIAGFCGSILLILSIFIISLFFSFPSGIGGEIGVLQSPLFPLFPFFLSFLASISSLITLFLWIKLLSLTESEKYRSSGEIYGQIGIFFILCYVCFTPVYIVLGMQNSELISLVFLIHLLVSIFISSIILELLSSYRYILIGLYGNFLALFLSSVFSFLIYGMMSTGKAKLFILLLLFPLILGLFSGVRSLFERMYTSYYHFTNMDPLGDIFKKVEQEEKEQYKTESQKNIL